MHNCIIKRLVHEYVVYRIVCILVTVVRIILDVAHYTSSYTLVEESHFGTPMHIAATATTLV